MLLTGERQCPLLHVSRQPAPRELVGDREEAAHQPLTGFDRLDPQAAGDLLGSPTPQHRLDDGVFGAQMCHARHEFEMCGTCQIDPSHPASRLPFEDGILHLTGSVCKLADQGLWTSRQVLLLGERHEQATCTFSPV